MTLFQKILLFSLIPVFTMIAGGVIAIIRKPSGNVRSLILHFAAGVVFSVVAVEILPDIIKNHMPFITVIGFVLGLSTMIAIKKLLEGKVEKISVSASDAIPWGLLTGIGVDILIDGLLLGIGFAAGSTEGILLAVALAVELLSLGMATATELGNSKISKKKSIGLIIGLAALFFISAVIGATILNNASHNVLDLVLSFGLAALLFLVTEELLKEAHEEKETVWHTSAFFGGFLLFVILGMYV
ncbi:MAG: ZIP family metal transporter [Chitinophagaceae bacterium]